MTAVRKFLFDIEFDDPEPNLPEEAEDAADESEAEAPEPVEETPPPPTFSEEEMEAARAESFAAGKQEGVRESAAAMERQISETLNGIAAHLGELFEAEQKDVTHLHALGIQMIRALAHKVLPRMSAEAGTAEIERLAANVLDRLRYEPHVLIAVHDSLSADLDARMQAIAGVQGFAGTVEVVADESVTPGDCRIEWSDGGAERQTDELMREIDAIVERHLAGILDADESNEPERPAESDLTFDPEIEAEAEAPLDAEAEAALDIEAEVVAESEPQPEPEVVTGIEDGNAPDVETDTDTGDGPDAATAPDGDEMAADLPEDATLPDDSPLPEDATLPDDGDADLAPIGEETDGAEIGAEIMEDPEESMPEPSEDGAETPVSDDETPDGSRQGE